MKNIETGRVTERVRSYNLPRRRMGKNLFFMNLFKQGGDSRPKGKVLVFENEEITRTKLCLMLASCGFQPLVPDTHISDLYNPDSFDAVIADMHCPNAFTFVKGLLDSGAGARIVASGFDPNEPAMAGIGHAFSGILKKPYRISQLKRVLHEAFSAKPATRLTGAVPE